MRFRRDAPVVLIVATALVIATLSGATYLLFANQMSEIEAADYRQMQAVMDSSLRAAEDRALARADLIASLPTVRAAFAAGDRARLLAECADMFAVQRDKYGVDQAQFVTADNTSFLRLNAPTRFGDDLSSFRPVIVATNRDKVARKALSLTRSGPALVGVVPVAGPDNNHIGVFEMGMEFAPILDKMKSTFGYDSSFFVKEKQLREISTNVSSEILDEQNRFGEYLKYASTNSALMKGLIQGSDLAQVNGEPVQYSRSVAGIDYAVTLLALRNAAGESLGVVVAINDVSELRSAAGRTLVLQIVFGLLALILLAGVITVIIRGFLLRPLAILNKSFEQLRHGDASVIDVNDAVLCEELQVTSGLYRHLSQACQNPGAALGKAIKETS